MVEITVRVDFEGYWRERSINVVLKETGRSDKVLLKYQLRLS